MRQGDSPSRPLGKHTDGHWVKVHQKLLVVDHQLCSISYACRKFILSLIAEKQQGMYFVAGTSKAVLHIKTIKALHMCIADA